MAWKNLKDLEEDSDERMAGQFPTQLLVLLIGTLVSVSLFFSLRTISTPNYDRSVFYIVLLLSSYLFVFMATFIGKMAGREPIEWYRNLDLKAVPIIGLTIALSVVTQLAMGTVFQGMGWQLLPGPGFMKPMPIELSPEYPFTTLGAMPTNLPPLQLAFLPQSWSNLLQSIFWQSFAVANSEEIFKTTIIVIGFLIINKKRIGGAKLGSALLIVSLTLIVWSSGHAVVAYNGNSSAVLTAAAVGAIMVWSFFATHSILAPLIEHATLNVMYSASSLGITIGSLIPHAQQLILPILRMFGA